MTLDLEANEVEVKGLTSLASVTETTGLILSALICFSVFAGNAVEAERDRFLESLGACVVFFLNWVLAGSEETRGGRRARRRRRFPAKMKLLIRTVGMRLMKLVELHRVR